MSWAYSAVFEGPVDSFWPSLAAYQKRRGKARFAPLAAVMAVRGDGHPIQPVEVESGLDWLVAVPLPLWATGGTGNRRYVLNVALVRKGRIQREWDAGLRPVPRRPKLRPAQLEPGPIGPSGRWEKKQTAGEVRFVGPRRWELRLPAQEAEAAVIAGRRLVIRRPVRAAVPVLHRGEPVLTSVGRHLPADEPAQLGRVARLVRALMEGKETPPHQLPDLYAPVREDEQVWPLRMERPLQELMLLELGPAGSACVRSRLEGTIEKIVPSPSNEGALEVVVGGASQLVPPHVVRGVGQQVAIGEPLAQFCPRFVWGSDFESSWMTLESELGPFVYWAARECAATRAVRQAGRLWLPEAITTERPSAVRLPAEGLMEDGRAWAACVRHDWRTPKVKVGSIELPAYSAGSIVPAATR